jgi:hypothetical protein
MGKRREAMNRVRPPEGGRIGGHRAVLHGGWRPGALAALALLACGGAAAGEAEAPRRRVIPLAVSVNVVRPFSDTTRERFGDTWFGIGGGIFDRRHPDQWRFNFDVEYRKEEDLGEAKLIPVTFGVARGLGSKTKGDWQPYAALRVGPYYGKVEGDRLPIEDETIGFNSNVSVGVLYRDRYSLSLRYDYFSRFADTNFDGLSLRAAVRVLDLKL